MLFSKKVVVYEMCLSIFKKKYDSYIQFYAVSAIIQPYNGEFIYEKRIKPFHIIIEVYMYWFGFSKIIYRNQRTGITSGS